MGKAVVPAWTALEMSSAERTTLDTLQIGNRGAQRRQQGEEYADTFVFPVSHRMGLPPGEVSRLVRATFRRVCELRPRASLWVPVAAPGQWFRTQVRAEMWGTKNSYVVTSAGAGRPGSRYFSYPPPRSHSIAPALPAEAPRILGYSPREQEVLLVMARLRSATASEVAACVDCSVRHTRRLCDTLERDDCFERTGQDDDYTTWSITRRGTLIARRGWGIPPNTQFGGGRERSRGGSRHRRTARLWPAWLREAYPDAEIWAGWSEPRGLSTGGHQADALAWGSYRGHETVFWLEVESGKRSRAELRRDMEYRLTEITMKYAGYQAVVGVLAMPWAARAVLPTLTEISPHVAVVLEDWKNVGSLPRPAFGEVTVSNAIKK